MEQARVLCCVWLLECSSPLALDHPQLPAIRESALSQPPAPGQCEPRPLALLQACPGRPSWPARVGSSSTMPCSREERPCAAARLPAAAAACRLPLAAACRSTDSGASPCLRPLQPSCSCGSIQQQQVERLSGCTATARARASICGTPPPQHRPNTAAAAAQPPPPPRRTPCFLCWPAAGSLCCARRS